MDEHKEDMVKAAEIQKEKAKKVAKVQAMIKKQKAKDAKEEAEEKKYTNPELNVFLNNSSNSENLLDTLLKGTKISPY